MALTPEQIQEIAKSRGESIMPPDAPHADNRAIELHDAWGAADELQIKENKGDQTKENPLFTAQPVENKVSRKASRIGATSRPTSEPAPEDKLGQGTAAVANALTQSEQNFGKDIAQGFYLQFGGQKNIDKVTQSHLDNAATLTDLIKKNTNPDMNEKYKRMAISEIEDAQKVGKSVIGETRTPMQIVGDALGVAADVTMGGTLNNSMTSFKLLGAAEKANLAANGIKSAAAFNALSKADKLKFLGVETAKLTAKGAAIGYGMDVAHNLQEGQEGGDALKPGLGTVLGAGVPLVIGGVKMTATALKNPDTAGRVVNSLVKPRSKDFAYGKNPGKTIAEEGITANSLDDLGEKVGQRKIEVGQNMGDVVDKLDRKGEYVNLSTASAPLDKAIEDAKKAPLTNKALIERLENLKADLFEKTPRANLPHGLKALEYNSLVQIAQDNPEAAQFLTDIDLSKAKKGTEITDILRKAADDGQKISNVDLSKAATAQDAAKMLLDKLPEDMRTQDVITALDRWGKQGDQIADYVKLDDIKQMSFKDALEMKRMVGEMSHWTGNPSDDEALNKALKQTYGAIDEQLTKTAQKADPLSAKEFQTLNDKYGNLLTAEKAIKYRDTIAQRANMVSMPVKVGTITGLLTAVANGGKTIPAILAGVGADMFTKALSSTTFKTHIASWLAEESPGVVEALYKANPGIRNALIKLGSSGALSKEKPPLSE